MGVSAYLSFPGTCEEALRFYVDCLNGEILAMNAWGTSPMASQMPPGWQDKILHGRIRIADTVLMGSDAPPDRYQAPKGTSLALTVADPAEAERAFNALAQGGTVGMPLQKTFWSERFGMLVDRYGMAWMVNCEATG